ncbi:MAG: hypothetical protein V2I67_14420 [Thermoanaerobaculales bacterium]|jgi:hypothetical protein|nr:hypothetical protein [Thermoanaerobaculales bacterium]
MGLHLRLLIGLAVDPMCGYAFPINDFVVQPADGTLRVSPFLKGDPTRGAGTSVCSVVLDDQPGIVSETLNYGRHSGDIDT